MEVSKSTAHHVYSGHAWEIELYIGIGFSFVVDTNM
jgi:hypothetical protein